MIPKDKIIADLNGDENKALDDVFSRAEAGDSFSGTFTASMDEYQNKIVVLSLDELGLKGVAKAEAEVEEEVAASVSLFKKNGKAKTKA